MMMQLWGQGEFCVCPGHPNKTMGQRKAFRLMAHLCFNSVLTVHLFNLNKLTVHLINLNKLTVHLINLNNKTIGTPNKTKLSKWREASIQNIGYRDEPS
jgi:hypothetical protein